MIHDALLTIPFGTSIGNWTIEPLTDYVFFQEGPGLREWQWRPSGMKVVNGRNIVAEGVIDTANTERFISLDEFNTRYSRFAIEPGDILVTSSGTIGKVAKVTPTHLPMMMNTSVIRFHPKSEDTLTRGYLYAFLRSHLFKDQAATFATGAAQSNFGPAHIKQMRIALPPLPTQRKIASILSAYDDLIENNTRHIKLLEEMAQALYREWFVHFRFPGHEGVRLVESELGLVPEGWSVRQMSQVADVIDCLHSKKPQDVGEGGLLLQVWNIGEGGRLDMSKQYRVTDQAYELWTTRIEVTTGDCVVTNVGRIGAVAQIPLGMKAAIGRNMTAIRPDPHYMTPAYLIQYLLSPHMQSEVSMKKDAGTIMDSLNVKGIVKLNVPLPPSDLLHHFDSIAQPMRRRMEVLVEQNANLRRTRDLLLPKLISGELDIQSSEDVII